MLLEYRTVKKTSRALNKKKIKSSSVAQFSQISNERLKSDVFSRRMKTDSDGDAVTQWRQTVSNASCSDSESTVTDGDTTRMYILQPGK